MSKKQLHIKSGDFVFLDKEEKTGALNVQKWLRKILKSFGVPLVDPCCPSDPTAMPVRWNEDEGALQRFDSTTETWMNI